MIETLEQAIAAHVCTHCYNGDHDLCWGWTLNEQQRGVFCECHKAGHEHVMQSQDQPAEQAADVMASVPLCDLEA